MKEKLAYIKNKRFNGIDVFKINPNVVKKIIKKWYIDIEDGISDKDIEYIIQL